MTQAATDFVSPTTFQALSGEPVLLDTHDAAGGNGMAHINLSRQTDVMLIAPASANTLAKIAHGMADNLLTTLVAARTCPLAVAPAMNVQMWNNPANQRNLALLRQDQIKILGPAVGEQACGETGSGRMLEAAELAELLADVWTLPVLAGKRVLITTGATLKPLIRYAVLPIFPADRWVWLWHVPAVRPEQVYLWFTDRLIRQWQQGWLTLNRLSAQILC